MHGVCCVLTEKMTSAPNLHKTIRDSNENPYFENIQRQTHREKILFTDKLIILLVTLWSVESIHARKGCLLSCFSMYSPKLFGIAELVIPKSRMEKPTREKFKFLLGDSIFRRNHTRNQKHTKKKTTEFLFEDEGLQRPSRHKNSAIFCFLLYILAIISTYCYCANEIVDKLQPLEFIWLVVCRV